MNFRCAKDTQWVITLPLGEDPLIKRNKRSYCALLRKLHDAGVIEYRRSCRENVGMFTVWKKSGKQRLVVDARFANCWFAALEGVRLAASVTLKWMEDHQLRLAELTLLMPSTRLNYQQVYVICWGCYRYVLIFLGSIELLKVRFLFTTRWFPFSG